MVASMLFMVTTVGLETTLVLDIVWRAEMMTLKSLALNTALARRSVVAPLVKPVRVLKALLAVLAKPLLMVLARAVLRLVPELVLELVPELMPELMPVMFDVLLVVLPPIVFVVVVVVLAGSVTVVTVLTAPGSGIAWTWGAPVGS